MAEQTGTYLHPNDDGTHQILVRGVEKTALCLENVTGLEEDDMIVYTTITRPRRLLIVGTVK